MDKFDKEKSLWGLDEDLILGLYERGNLTFCLAIDGELKDILIQDMTYIELSKALALVFTRKDYNGTWFKVLGPELELRSNEIEKLLGCSLSDYYKNYNNILTADQYLEQSKTTKLQIIAEQHDLCLADLYGEYGEHQREILLVGFKTEEQFQKIASMYGLKEFTFKNSRFKGITSNKKIGRDTLKKGLWY